MTHSAMPTSGKGGHHRQNNEDSPSTTRGSVPAQDLEPAVLAPVPGTPNPEQIEAFLEAINPDGDVLEVRIPKPRFGRGVQAGYFDNQDAAVSALAPISGRHAEGVYLTLNPVNPDLLGRADNRLANLRDTTRDADVVRRAHVLFDVDPQRPSGVSATDSQMGRALEVRDRLHSYLADNGWPEPLIIGRSGNGGALIYRVDLPNDEAATRLVKGVLESAASLFDTDDVKVDRSVYNAARITKVYGTVAAKGDHTASQPWRTAVMDACNGETEPVSTDLLAALASNARSTAPEPAVRSSAIRDVLAAKGITFREKDLGYALSLSLDRCLTSDAHSDGAAILEFPNGALSYTCRHDSCKGKRWSDVRALLGYTGASATPELSVDNVSDLITSGSRLLIEHFQDPRWAIDGLIPEGLSMLVARPKMGKSWLALDAVASIAVGRPVLGKTPTRGSTLYVALEDSKRRIQDRLAQVLSSDVKMTGEGFFDVDLSSLPDPRQLDVAVRWPRLDEGGLGLIDTWLTSHPDARLVVLDTWGRIKPRAGRGNAYDEDYAALAPVQALAIKHSVAILLVHHMRKMETDDPLDAINGSMGLAGALDAALILKRERSRADAHLYLTGRDIRDDGDIPLSWDVASARWSISGNAAEARLSTERADVLRVVREAGQLISGRSIAQILSRPEGTIRRLAAELVKSQHLANSGKGYTLGAAAGGTEQGEHPEQGEHIEHPEQMPNPGSPVPVAKGPRQ